jgi:sulfatase modifying factor 1
MNTEILLSVVLTVLFGGLGSAVVSAADEPGKKGQGDSAAPVADHGDPGDHTSWMTLVTGAEAKLYAARYEVTQQLWKKIAGGLPASQTSEGDHLPVGSVSFVACLDFCNRLSEKDGFTPCYYSDAAFAKVYKMSDGASFHWNRAANGYRLPTVEEWIFAAKGGDQGKGLKYAGSDDIDAVAWIEGNSGGKPHEVGLKAANELGLCDIQGNVYELCWDAFRGQEGTRVRSGGSFAGKASRCAFSNQRGAGVTGSKAYVGLRLFRSE